MLSVGDRAPDFVAVTTDGRTLRLSSLRGKTVVLYFFRRAFTRNCVRETRGFRDNYPELQALGAEVVGVSCDDHATQCRFAEEEQASFPMIADADRRISKSYRTFFSLLPGVSHRVTYVLDPEGIIEGVFNHEFAVLKHLDEVVGFVRKRAAPEQA